MSELFNRLMRVNAATEHNVLLGVCREAAKELAHQEAAQLVLQGEVEKLHTRLEDNFAYKTVEGKEGLQRYAVEPGSIPDGIDCRNETIKLQEAKIASLERLLAAAVGKADE